MRDIIKCDYCGTYAKAENILATPDKWYMVYNDDVSLDFCSAQCIASWATLIYNSQPEKVEHATPW